MAGGQKMAKSTGNLVFVHDLLERWSAAAIRFIILSRPWNESWEFAHSELDQAERDVEELRFLEGKPGRSSAAAEEVQRALFDNLDLPRALAVAKDRTAPLHDSMSLLGLQYASRPRDDTMEQARWAPATRRDTPKPSISGPSRPSASPWRSSSARIPACAWPVGSVSRPTASGGLVSLPLV